MNDEYKLKGMFFREIVQVVLDERGDEGVSELADRLGVPMDFSLFKSYPVELFMRLLDAAGHMLFGDDMQRAYLELGKLSWRTFAASAIGKTVLALYGNDLKKSAMNISQLWNTIIDFGERSSEDLGERKVRVVIQDDPRDAAYLEGILTAAIEHFGFIPLVECHVLGPQHYEFILEWEPRQSE